MKQFAEKNGKVVTFGPVEQRHWIQTLGGDVRIDRLIQSAVPDLRGQIQSGYEMLTDPKQMGSRFKFFSMFPSVLGDHLHKYPPVGFETKN